MSFWTLYWLSRLDGFKELLVFFSVVGGIILAVSVIFFFLADGGSNDKEEVTVHRISRLGMCVFIPVFIISISGQVLIPTFKQALMFMGIDYVTHNERVLENTDKAIDVFEAYIDQKLNQIKGGKLDESKGKGSTGER